MTNLGMLVIIAAGVVGVVAVCILIGWVLYTCGVRVRPVETRIVDSISITGVFHEQKNDGPD